MLHKECFDYVWMSGHMDVLKRPIYIIVHPVCQVAFYFVGEKYPHLWPHLWSYLEYQSYWWQLWHPAFLALNKGYLWSVQITHLGLVHGLLPYCGRIPQHSRYVMANWRLILTHFFLVFKYERFFSLHSKIRAKFIQDTQCIWTEPKDRKFAKKTEYLKL